MRKCWHLLERPRTWTQKYSARIEMRPTVADDPGADCWCALGAIIKCYPDPVKQEAVVLLVSRHLERVHHVPRYHTDFDHDVITRWNDAPRRTHQEVCQVFHFLNV